MQQYVGIFGPFSILAQSERDSLIIIYAAWAIIWIDVTAV